MGGGLMLEINIKKIADKGVVSSIFRGFEKKGGVHKKKAS